MLCKDIITELNRLAPQDLACEWDNPGFQAGRADKEVHKILVALDATDEVVDQAVREGADMIVTHHPLIFRPVKHVNDEDFIGRRLVKMIGHDICYFAMHTNFDIAPGCMADLAAAQLGMTAEEPLEVTGEVDGTPVGIGKVGYLKEPSGCSGKMSGNGETASMQASFTVTEIAALVKERFRLPYVTVYGTEQVTGPIRRIAISPGSGGSMVSAAMEKQAGVLITGDIGHHDGIDAAANGVAVIDAGHYGIERIFIPFVRSYLEKRFGSELTVTEADAAYPSRVIV